MDLAFLLLIHASVCELGCWFTGGDKSIDRLLNPGRVPQDLAYVAGDSYDGAHISHFLSLTGC
jgi:hypothetical protein